HVRAHVGLAAALRNGVQRLHDALGPAEDVVHGGAAAHPRAPLVGARRLPALPGVRALLVVGRAGARLAPARAAVGAVRVPALPRAEHRAAHVQPARMDLPALRERGYAPAAERARPGAGMSARGPRLLAGLILVLAGVAAREATAGSVGAQFRYWSFRDHNDN